MSPLGRGPTRVTRRRPGVPSGSVLTRLTALVSTISARESTSGAAIFTIPTITKTHPRGIPKALPQGEDDLRAAAPGDTGLNSAAALPEAPCRRLSNTRITGFEWRRAFKVTAFPWKRHRWSNASRSCGLLGHHRDLYGYRDIRGKTDRNLNVP